MGSAPFSLLTYDDVKVRARQIVSVTKNRVMPPWKPEPGYGEFIGERRLRDEEIARFERWVQQGAAEGDVAAMPATPQWSDSWQQGEPDLVLTMAEAYTLPASGSDVFRNFVIPIPVATTRYVKAWEFRPGNVKVVHHATMAIDPTRSSRQLDEQDREPGYQGLVPVSVRDPEGFFLGWTPGQQQPQMAPENMAWRLEPQSDLVLTIHLRPTGKSEPIRASLGLYFTDLPPARVPATLRLGRQNIDMLPGDNHYTISNKYILPVDLHIYSVYPHAHYLAKEMKAVATLPDGTAQPLLYIKDWDFNWQDVYRYRKPLLLPKGTTVAMEYSYDNSDSNPHNTRHPPQRVTYGPNSSDEMGDLWLQVVPVTAADAAILSDDFWRTLLPENITGLEMMLRADPKNVGLHDQVARLYEDSGDFDRAGDHFGESLQLSPESATAHNNVASILLKQAKPGEAHEHLVTALRLDPNYGDAHFNLGILLVQTGRTAEAIEEFRTAVRVDPNDADAHYLLAHTAGSQGDLQEAIEQYRQAIALKPGWPIPIMELAWVLATSPDDDVRRPGEALSLAQRAAKLVPPPSAIVLDVLAASLAALGDFDQAIAAGQAAVATAVGNRMDEVVVQEIRERLGLYHQHEPYRSPR